MRRALSVFVLAALVLQISSVKEKKKDKDIVKFVRKTRPVLESVKFNATKYAQQLKNLTQKPVETEAEEEEEEGEKPKSGSKKGTMGINLHIINGRQAYRGMFPWQASITIDQQSFCGGSLITYSHILSAAHCVDRTHSYQILLGAQNTKYREQGRVSIQSRRKVMHPEWNPNTLKSDISIIMLPRRVYPNQFISLMRLPYADDAPDSPGVQATVCGWGKTKDRARFVSSSLLFTQLVVVEPEECISLYGSGSFHDTNLCAAGDNNRATCQGDSGGPLVVREDDGEWTQIGVVSYGAAAGCGRGYPDVFTKVSAFVDWIASRTSGSNSGMRSAGGNFYYVRK